MKDVIHHVWQADTYHEHSSVQSDAAADLLQTISLKGNEHILDVGCGDGKITARLARSLPLGFIQGIDLSNEMIAFAQKKYSNVTFKVQGAEEIDYPGQFDIIFSSFALQWVKNRDAFFLGANRSLKPGGHLAATIPLGVSYALETSIAEILALPQWKPYFANFIQTWDFPKEEELAQLLKKHGFATLRLATVSCEVIFSSREEFEQYVLPWFVYLKFLPDPFKQVFFQTVMDRYFELEPLLDEEKVRFAFLRIDLVAQKLPSRP